MNAHHLFLSWAIWFASMPHNPISLGFILILSSHLCTGLPQCLFPSGIPTKTLKTSLLPYWRNLCRTAICKSEGQSLWWSYQCCQVATNFLRIQAFWYTKLCHWAGSSWCSKYHPPFTDKHSKQDPSLAAWQWRYRQHSFEIMVTTCPVTQHSILEIFNIWQYHRVNFNSRNVLWLEIYWKTFTVLIYISGMSLYKETS